MMKLNKYTWLAVLPMIFTACQEDTLVENQPKDGKVYTLTADMDGGAAMSRAQIQLGKETSGEELFFWNENDEFDLYLDGNTEPKVFAIDRNYSEPSQGEQKTATFTTTTPVPIEEDYVAVYPAGVFMEDNSFEFIINNYLEFNSWTEKEDIWASYLQDNMYMMANGKFEDPNDASVSFNHLCALIRISYLNNTNTEQVINRISISSENQKFSTVYKYSLDGTVSTEPVSSLELWTEGLRVQSKETADFYMLFFPEKFSDVANAVVNIEITTDNMERDGDVLIDLAAIKDANKNDEGFKAGKRYWFKVTETDKGLSWTNYTKTVEVDDFEGFKAAMENETVTNIALKNPIIIDNLEEGIRNIGHKVISPIANGFTWKVNEIEENALIINKADNLNLYDCTIQGEIEDSNEEKYLLKNIGAGISLSNANLVADGQMNAIRLENSIAYLYGEISIDVENGMNAFSVISTTGRSNVSISIDGEINGNVNVVSNGAEDENCDRFSMSQGTLNGDIMTDGETVDYLIIELGEGAVYKGNKTVEIASVKDFQKYLMNDAITNIVLKNPIVFTEDNKFSNFNFTSHKTITMSENFTWSVDGNDYNALFINKIAESMELYFMNCTINGSIENSEKEKFLIESHGNMYLWGAACLNAYGDMNAVKVENSWFRVDENASISVEHHKSFYVKSSETIEARLDVNSGTIQGDVYFESNYYVDGKTDHFFFNGGTLNGDIIICGTQAQHLYVSIDEENAVFGGNKTIQTSSLDN